MKGGQLRRKHVTSACRACRESKIRCDGIRPSCGNCSKKGKECYFTGNDDKRKVSLRTAIGILSDRVNILTQLLDDNGITIPSLDAQQDQLLRDICNTLKLSVSFTSQDALDTDRPSSPSDTPVADIENSGVRQQATSAGIESVFQPSLVSPANPVSTNNQIDSSLVSNDLFAGTSPVDWPWHIVSSDTFLFSTSLDFNTYYEDSMLAQHGDSSTAIALDFSQDSAIILGTDATVDDDHLTKDVSARFGALRIASDGQLRYYGAATNYHLLEESHHDEEVETENIQKEVLDRLEQAGLNHIVPQDLEASLIELFFTWHNPSHGIVDQDTFFATKNADSQAQVDKNQTNAVLLNAICAIGAAYETRYHPTFVTYPRPLADYFASRAIMLLELDLECPKIETIQALCLLSNHESARNRDARTWLYGGMAMRLCFDLGLHIDCSAYVASGVLSLADARTRQNTFWSCVLVNHLLSFHFGRPFRIDSEEITVGMPVGSPGTMDNRKPGSAMLQNWTFLCEMLVPLIRKLYGSSSTPVLTLQEISMSITNQLESWWAEIPASWKNPKQVVSPEVLILMMAYHHFQILIHRPWTSHRLQMCVKQGPGSHHARYVCSASALSIADLLNRYEKEYTFKRMHSYGVNIVFSAALISLFNVLTLDAGPRQVQATSSLSVFFRALDDLSQSFGSAKRAREHLATIQRKWYISKNSAVSGSKRTQPTSSYRHTRKRSKFNNAELIRD